jgi:hypothetical protein
MLNRMPPDPERAGMSRPGDNPMPPSPPGTREARRDIVAIVWIGGVVLAVAVYAVGPDNFVTEIWNGLRRGWLFFQDLIANLTAAAFDAVRAAAIGLFAIFLSLCALVIRHGGRGRMALVVVSVLFLLCVWDANRGSYVASSRWTAALALAGMGALVMTRRLTHPEPGPTWRRGVRPPR